MCFAAFPPPVLQHRLCFPGVWGCGGARKVPATESCRDREEMSTCQHCSTVKK